MIHLKFFKTLLRQRLSCYLAGATESRQVGQKFVGSNNLPGHL